MSAIRNAGSASTFTKAALHRGFRGHLYHGRDFVGGVYLIDGVGYVLDVDNGQVRRVIGTHRPSEFRRAGQSALSASRTVTHWELA